MGGNKAPIGEIRMILGGLVARGSSKSLKKVYAREVNNVHSRFPPSKMSRYSEPDIVFSKKNAHGIKWPHNDALVIMLTMEEFNIHQVLVDNGSSADIIYLLAFQQMKLSKERLRPFTSLLVSFTEDRVISRVVVKLTIIAGTYLAQVCKKIDFFMVDCPSMYNVILGRLMLNKLKAGTSTYYLKVKFPTAHSIREIRGDLVLARKCYQAALALRENHTWMIDELELVLELLEVPQEMKVIPGYSSKVLKIGLAFLASEMMKITNFLRENLDVFAWKYEDMLGINREVI